MARMRMRTRGGHRYPRALRERYALNVELRFVRLASAVGESAKIAAKAAREMSAALDRARASLSDVLRERTSNVDLGWRRAGPS